MNIVVANRRVRKALASLNPTKLSISKDSPGVLAIEIHSEAFNSMNFIQRIKRVLHLIRTNAKTVDREYITIIYPYPTNSEKM